MGGAAVPEPSGKGKKKALDAVVNVVPFIDLLSCCLAFLLITAVWTQVGKIQVSQAGGISETPPDNKTLTLTLTVTDKGYALMSGQDAAVIDIAKKGTEYDIVGLTDKLKEIKARFPDQHAITVQPEDSIQYNDLVQAIDTCIKNGLEAVSVQAIT
jgi:biopolymer transport protein TolR